MSTRSQLLLLAFIVTIGLLSNVGTLLGVPVSPVAAVFLLLAAVASAYAVLEMWRERRRAPVLTIGPDGVTVRGRPTATWDRIDSVRVSGTKPRWAVGGGRWAPMVAFVPREGHRLPSISEAQRPRVPWVRSLSRHQYGSELPIPVRFVQPTLDEVLAAVRRHSDVPVSDVR